MNWSDISGAIGKFAPMIGTLIGGPAGAALGSVVASALGVENTPEAVKKVLSEDGQRAAELLQQLQEKNKHQYEMMLLETQKTAITQQALTAREELKSEDVYVRRWRPTFGYALALSFLIFSSAFAYLLYMLITKPTGMAEVVTSVSQLMGPVSMIWGMALAVLGVNVHSRSKDKQTGAGMAPSKFNLIGKLFNKE